MEGDENVTPDIIAVTIVCGIISGVISTYIIRVIDKCKNDRHCGKSGH